MIEEVNYDDENFLPTLEEQKEYILNETNFEYIANVLQMPIKESKTPWIVRYSDGTFRIPDVKMLKSTADDLLSGAIKADTDVYSCRFGPFRVTKIYNRLILDLCIYTMSYD